MRPWTAAIAILLLLAAGGCVSVDGTGPSRMLYGLGRQDSAGGRPGGAFEGRYTHRAVARGLRYVAGFDASVRGSLYVHGGFAMDIRFLDLHDDVIITPAMGVGYYHRGGGPDIGGHVHFRTGFTVAYELDDGIRFGLSWNHISNLGLEGGNPGRETTMLVLEIPFSGGSSDD